MSCQIACESRMIDLTCGNRGDVERGKEMGSGGIDDIWRCVVYRHDEHRLEDLGEKNAAVLSDVNVIRRYRAGRAIFRISIEVRAICARV